jgi:hypothetical protein
MTTQETLLNSAEIREGFTGALKNYFKIQYLRNYEVKYVKSITRPY